MSTERDETAEASHALAMDIAGCLSNVSDLPDWMRVHALGRPMTPLVELAAAAVLRSDWLARDRAAAFERGRAEGAAAALKDAADDIVADCTNRPGPCICVANDWLRDRAALTDDDHATGTNRATRETP